MPPGPRAATRATPLRIAPPSRMVDPMSRAFTSAPSLRTIASSARALLPGGLLLLLRPART